MVSRSSGWFPAGFPPVSRPFPARRVSFPPVSRPLSYIREWGENYTQKWKDLKKNKEGFKALVVTNSDANKDRPTVRRIVHDKEYLQASRGKRKEHRIRRPKRPTTYPSWIKHAMSEDGGGYNQSLSIINPKLHK